MKKLKNIIVLLLGVLLLTSCDDFLDKKPTNSADSATSIQNEFDAKVAVNGLMRRMIDANNYGRNIIMYADAKGGDLAIRQTGRGLDALYLFTHSQQSNNYSGYWTDSYVTIIQTNNIILNIEAMEEDGYTSAMLSHYKGQALTARALLYFNLVRLYGQPYNKDKSAYGVPLILDIPDAASQPTRASVEEIYTQIVTDLKAGEPLLRDAPEKGFINKWANLAIQARVYLHMDNMGAALTAAEAVINSGKYSLYSNANWTDSWGHEAGSESIFELSMRLNEGQQGTASLGYYLLPNGKITGASGQFMASTHFLDLLGEDPTDIRWEVMDEDESSTDTDPRFGSCLKYAGGPAMNGDKGDGPGVSNIKVIRLSEVYLIAAEAALLVDPGKAAGYLQEIRKRAPGLAPATASNITLDMILNEKSKELFAEGNRYWDLLRLGKVVQFDDAFNITAASPHRPVNQMDTWLEHRAILPIPQMEIDANPGLEAQQNPGY